MSARLVVVGASAGGVEALSTLVRDLPADFPAPVVAVLHRPARAPSSLPQILARAGRLPVRHAEDGDLLEPGTIYVAPPDRHVLVREDRLEVTRGPRENGHRPAIDPLFRSAAAAAGAGVVAVVLSGVLDDGAAGSVAVSRGGGAVVVQDPDDAPFGDMPRNAIADDSPAAILGIDEIGKWVTARVKEPTTSDGHAEQPREAEVAGLGGGVASRGRPAREQSAFSCPECGGALAQVEDGAALRFRCRVGHAYTVEALLAEQGETVEAALWTALRALEERADLSARLARRLRRTNLEQRAHRAAEAAEHDRRRAEIVRDVLARVA